jgi:hypothetical protein
MKRTLTADLAAQAAAKLAAGIGLTPNELARVLRLSPDRIRAMIVRGELPALNVASSRCGKARFIILPHHLRDWETGRAAAPPRPAPRRRRRQYAVDYLPDGQEAAAS